MRNDENAAPDVGNGLRSIHTDPDAYDARDRSRASGEGEATDGHHERCPLLHAGLEALIARESARRLAALGGTEPALRRTRRRRRD